MTRVWHRNNRPRPFTHTPNNGKGVSITEPIAATGISATATTAVNMVDPSQAVLLDGKSQTVPANEILNKWWTNDPIGVRRPEMQMCSTGWCRGNDLVGVGAFGMDGTYYVRMINGTENDLPAVLTLTVR